MRIFAVLLAVQQLAVEQADHQFDMLAFERYAALFEEFHDTFDVGGAAADAGAGRFARGIETEGFVVDDGGGVKLSRQMLGGEFVGAIEAFGIAQPLVDDPLHDRAVLPAERFRLLPPDLFFVGFDLAEPALSAGGMFGSPATGVSKR
jgi:hypothetical protein